MARLTAREMLEILDGRTPSTPEAEAAQREIQLLEQESRECEDADPWEAARSEWLSDQFNNWWNEQTPCPKDLLRAAAFLERLSGEVEDDVDPAVLRNRLVVRHLKLVAAKCRKAGAAMLDMISSLAGGE